MWFCPDPGRFQRDRDGIGKKTREKKFNSQYRWSKARLKFEQTERNHPKEVVPESKSTVHLPEFSVGNLNRERECWLNQEKRREKCLSVPKV
jgi:hypothetical protein